MKIELLTISKTGLIMYKNELDTSSLWDKNIAGNILRIKNVNYKLNEDGSLEPIGDKKFKEIFNK